MVNFKSFVAVLVSFDVSSVKEEPWIDENVECGHKRRQDIDDILEHLVLPSRPDDTKKHEPFSFPNQRFVLDLHIGQAMQHYFLFNKCLRP